MLLMLILTTNMMFMFMNHPMSMGLTLIIQTLMIGMYTGMLMKTFWMSYVLIITMLSGMMVLFIYMSSLASNEKFKTSMKMWAMFMMLFLISTLFLSLSMKMIIKNNYLGMEMNYNKMEEIFYLNKLFMSNNMMITIMMVLYLLLTMIVSTMLVNISEGPMRLKI